MIALRIEAPFATFRKSFARGFAESYPLAPPATLYGMLLSLVGERFRSMHEGVRIAFAYKRVPRITTTLRKLSRLKYGVPGKQAELGNQPDYIETACGIDLICWVDSQFERTAGETLETRIMTALQSPQSIDRYGVVCLGLSDDAVDSITLLDTVSGAWLPVTPSDEGSLELPIWVDHVGSEGTRWQRYEIASEPAPISTIPDDRGWTTISRN